MTTDFNSVTAAWDDVAGTDLARTAIHPLGGVSDEAYDNSGAEQAQMIADLIALYLSPVTDPRILDFGCGDGRVAKYLTGTYADVWGADASPKMIQRLAESAPEVNGVVSNGIDGALANVGADVIFSMAVFIHHSIGDGRRLVRALAEATAPGGLLLLQIPCYSVSRERDNWCDVTVWDEQTLRDTAKACNLSVVEFNGHDHAFSFDNVGANHLLPQVLRKPAAGEH